LHLDSHQHTPPANQNLVGNYGTDTWQFSTLKTGTTTMHLSASRANRDSLNIFNHIIKIQ
jgi:predicted secreted protein